MYVCSPVRKRRALEASRCLPSRKSTTDRLQIVDFSGGASESSRIITTVTQKY